MPAGVRALPANLPEACSAKVRDVFHLCDARLAGVSLVFHLLPSARLVTTCPTPVVPVGRRLDDTRGMSRWLQETGGERGPSYAQAFSDLGASGADVHGEVDLLSRLVPAPATVLDAGCGTGRVGAELARRRYTVVGVDSDPSMLEVARDRPGVEWLEGDLATLALDDRFDLVVAAGNVVVFLEPGTEREVVRRLAAHLLPDGLLVSGWRTDRMPVEDYDAHTAAAGLVAVARYRTWQGEEWEQGADWCVAVDREEGTAVDREEGTAVDRAPAGRRGGGRLARPTLEL